MQNIYKNQHKLTVGSPLISNIPKLTWYWRPSVKHVENVAGGFICNLHRSDCVSQPGALYIQK
jgi:hypothetical protein